MNTPNIRTLPITNYIELKHRIMHLNARKVEQEAEIKHHIKELYYSLQPTELIKSVFKKVTGSEEKKSDLKKTGLALGADFLIGRLLGRSSSIKGFVSSIIVEKVASYVMNNHSDAISNGISKLKGLLKKEPTT